MINKTISDLVKRFGEGSVMLLSDAGNMQVETVSTGSLSLDIALGGGVPRGRIVEVYGPEACLDEDTFIQYNVRTPGGRRQNHKGGTIKRLYERFHGIVTPGKGYYQRVVSEGAIYTVPSFRSDGSVFQNPVADVVKTGLKECFEVSAGGLRIVSTADHKYYVGNGKFAPLSDLRAGDKVFLHAQGRVKGKKEVNRYTETTVKYHPLKPRKHVNGCTYYRVKRANMVYEANMNGLSLEEYTTALNTLPEHEIDKLWVVPKGYVLHHIDEDPNNDSLENLELLTGLEHNKRHAHQHQAKLSFAIEEVAIDSITPVGLRETYDIKCYAPYNNFIAQGFCVHNSGKTSVCLHIIAEAQKSGGYCAFVDMEHALDPEYAAKLGVDLTRLAVSQPDSGEQALEIAEAFVRSGDVDVVVVDSVAALVPQREIEGDMGDAQMGAQARLMSQALRKLAGAVSNSKCILIFTNQIRMKVGVMFGN